MRRKFLTVLVCCALLGTASSGYGQDKATDLAKKLQNPVGDLISVPLQNNFNFGWGLAVGSAPIITANWAAPSGQEWTVPLGAQISQIIPIAKVPVNFLLGGYYNIVKPDNGPEWSLRFQIALMFPN